MYSSQFTINLYKEVPTRNLSNYQQMTHNQLNVKSINSRKISKIMLFAKKIYKKKMATCEKLLSSETFLKNHIKITKGLKKWQEFPEPKLYN